MQHSAWVTLLKHIPEEHHGRLMLVTTFGAEISFQALLRIDPECLAVRGRIAGTQDAGKIFFVPYDQIVYFGFQTALKETEFKEIFDDLTLPEPPEPPDPAEVALGALPPAYAPPPAAYNGAASLPPPPPPPPPPSGSIPRIPITRAPVKSDVLERFRAKGSGPSNGSRDDHG
jgi:hypothetical protein